MSGLGGICRVRVICVGLGDIKASKVNKIFNNKIIQS